jgi:glutamine---fructose-6-phosphate transaminase (isomerizing)
MPPTRALKVREAAHLFTAGLAVEQLLHGPAFALGERDALVCLDGGGPGAARLAEVANAIAARGSRVYRFAAPELGEPLSVFQLTVTVQRVALEFPVQLGTDPTSSAPKNGKRSNSRPARTIPENPGMPPAGFEPAPRP